MINRKKICSLLAIAVLATNFGMVRANATTPTDTVPTVTEPTTQPSTTPITTTTPLPTIQPIDKNYPVVDLRNSYPLESGKYDIPLQGLQLHYYNKVEKNLPKN